MCHFSFSHNVFKRLVLQTRENQGLFGKGLNHFNSSSLVGCQYYILYSLSQAHIHLTVVDVFINRAQKMRQTGSPELSQVITELCNFYVIHNIVTDGGDFLEVNYISLLAELSFVTLTLYTPLQWAE